MQFTFQEVIFTDLFSIFVSRQLVLVVILRPRMNHQIEIALVGNPNSGKSSLFNALTGLNQKVGNFPGVTVDKKTGWFELADKKVAKIVDLPGSYSLYPRRKDESISYRVMMGLDKDINPNLTIIVADAGNLKRNLLYATQLIDLKKDVILVLTMMDIAIRQGQIIDTPKLQKELGIPVLPVNPRTKEGLSELKKLLASFTEKRPAPEKTFYVPGSELEEIVLNAKTILPGLSDYGALHVLTQKEILFEDEQLQNDIKYIQKNNTLSSERIQGEEILLRYKAIDQIIAQCVEKKSSYIKRSAESKADRFLLHPLWGYLFLLFVLFVLFQSIFWLAEYPMTAIEHFFAEAENILTPLLPSTWYADLLLQGLLPGLSGIFVFIPQIVILFGLIGILEETGYMARISFLTDKVMRKVGLNGKSVMPMISGFACAVPAIMSVRNIENRKERLLTILITPLMSCSARLPVYTILIAMVIPNESVLGILSLQGLVMMGLYLFGVLVALAVAWIAGRFIQMQEKSFFLLELPTYKMPQWKNVFYMMIEKARIFITDAGKVILVISMILWALSSYGPAETMKQTAAHYDSIITLKPQLANDLAAEKEAALLSESYAGLLGKFLEPAIQPLGYDWKIGIALITSFAAREVFVGTMATLYSVGGNKEDLQTLREKMASAKREDGSKVYSLATGVSLMLFYLLAMQCMSTLAVVKRETNSWKWPVIQLLYMSGLAYLISLLAFQLLK